MQEELFVAVLAGEAGGGVLRKALGAESEGQLPAKQDDEGHGQKAPGVGVGDEEQGGEHHGEIPVVDAAGGAALVLHEPGLEGTEEKDADDITNGIYTAQQDHNSVIQNPRHM